mmetsp:Transcript_2215/g.5329  ORF Transcript_2215/g.5329 Transcript_2215/m.5329 type:complete len:125 (+) Transcript_2215:225-599(+)
MVVCGTLAPSIGDAAHLDAPAGFLFGGLACFVRCLGPGPQVSIFHLCIRCAQVFTLQRAMHEVPLRLPADKRGRSGHGPRVLLCLPSPNKHQFSIAGTGDRPLRPRAREGPQLLPSLCGWVFMM